MPTNADRPRKQAAPRASKKAAGTPKAATAAGSAAKKAAAEKAAAARKAAAEKKAAASKRAAEKAAARKSAAAKKKAVAEKKAAMSVAYRVADDTPNQEGEKKMAETGSNAIKLVGEAVCPGASQLLDGEFKSGALHLLGGVLARAFLGPLGQFVVAANSYSKSVTKKPIHQHFTG